MPYPRQIASRALTTNLSLTSSTTPNITSDQAYKGLNKSDKKSLLVSLIIAIVLATLFTSAYYLGKLHRNYQKRKTIQSKEQAQNNEIIQSSQDNDEWVESCKGHFEKLLPEEICTCRMKRYSRNGGIGNSYHSQPTRPPRYLARESREEYYHRIAREHAPRSAVPLRDLPPMGQHEEVEREEEGEVRPPPYPFVRPVDIYRRAMEEENERYRMAT